MRDKLLAVITTGAVLASLMWTSSPIAKAASGSAVASELGNYEHVAIAIDKVNQPWGLAADADGNLVIVGSGNHGLYKWSDGKLSSIAGGQADGHIDGPVATAQFNHPTYAAADSKGTLYVADTNNHVVRKIVGSKVYTAAGTSNEGYEDGKPGEAQFDSPTGIAVDENDNVYVSDTLNHVIRRITPEGIVTTFAGRAGEDGGYKDGSAEEALFNEPMGLAFDEQGGLYVADSGNHLIRYIHDGKVTTFAGSPTEVDATTGYMAGGYRNGDSAAALFNRPRGLAYEQGVLFVADSLNYRIRAVQPDGKVITVAGQSTPGNKAGAADTAQFNQPSNVLYQSGKLYISDTLNHNVKVIEVETKALKRVRNEEDLLASTELLPASEDIQVWIDGQPVTFAFDKKAFASSDLLYIPIRSLFEAWGAEVTWDAEKRIVHVVKGDWETDWAPGVEQGVILQQGTTYVEASLLERNTAFLIARDEEFNALVIDSGQ